MISTIHPSRKLIQEPSVQEKLDKALFKKRSHEDWQQLILQWQHSGLSQKSFCEQHKINFHNFVYPRNKMRKDQSHQGSFASVNVVSNQTALASPDRFILQLQNGVKLVILNNYDSSVLKKLLTLLEVLPC